MANNNLHVDPDRVRRYSINQKLFEGSHFDAFQIKDPDGRFKGEYGRLRYVAVNFAGMLSKLSADTLFGYEEYPSITFSDDAAEKWYNSLDEDCGISTQVYESALENSFRGDAVWRFRWEDGQLFFEDVNPAIWQPVYDAGNVRKAPKAHLLRWLSTESLWVDSSGKQIPVWIEEKHTIGAIDTTAYLATENGIRLKELSPEEVTYLGYIPHVDTGIDAMTIIHIPNWRVNTSIFGIDDYRDVIQLIFAINNRITKIDNVLDRHGDPILAVPEGVIGKDGKVQKSAFGVVEIESGEGLDKPEYIVWDAKLESSFAEIEHLTEHLFITSETSPAAFGLDKQGQAESGRALKFKLLRTLAKKHRKQLYYDAALKQMIVTAQKLAKALNLKTSEGLGVSWEVIKPQIEWSDGIINDETEIMDLEERKLNAGLTSRVESLMRSEGISRKQAEDRIAEVDAESAKKVPVFNANPVSTVVVPPKA